MRPSLLPISGLKAGRSYFQLFLQFLKERRKEFLLLQSCLCQYVKDLFSVVPGRVELPTSTLSVWRSNQLSYRTVNIIPKRTRRTVYTASVYKTEPALQKGGVPAAPSGTATLLRLSPSHRFYPRPILAVTDFRHPRLPWLDGRCVQGPGTYSPRHG